MWFFWIRRKINSIYIYIYIRKERIYELQHFFFLRKRKLQRISNSYGIDWYYLLFVFDCACLSWNWVKGLKTSSHATIKKIQSYKVLSIRLLSHFFKLNLCCIWKWWIFSELFAFNVLLTSYIIIKRYMLIWKMIRIKIVFTHTKA